MKKIHVQCPHCGDLIEAVYDIEEVGQSENYENECETCNKYYSFEVATKVIKI